VYCTESWEHFRISKKKVWISKIEGDSNFIFALCLKGRQCETVSLTKSYHAICVFNL